MLSRADAIFNSDGNGQSEIEFHGSARLKLTFVCIHHGEEVAGYWH